MFSFSGLLLWGVFAVLLMSITDFFVNEPWNNQCSMTYMYQVPQYVPINLGSTINKAFPNYHLYSYGEGTYADLLRLEDYHGNPVVFVPGNGGSYKQVRSLASVALVMSYMTSDYAYFNYFTIDYNEELSAFIGSKLEIQTTFLYHAIKRVIHLYQRRDVPIILVGHSIGGLLIKSLLSKPFFKPYLHNIVLVVSLATPHNYPAIPFDMQTLHFYHWVNDQFVKNRLGPLGHINVISIGGSHNDKLIRSDLVAMNSSYKYDRSFLTTAIDDVWVSADHLCIVWCRQLMTKLNQLFFDLITNTNQSIVDSPEIRQKKIDYHLNGRHFSRSYPEYDSPEYVSYSTKTDWVEHDSRIVRLNVTKVISSINHLVPLNERETIVLHIEGTFYPTTASACKTIRMNEKLVCTEKAFSLYRLAKLVPTTNSQIDRHRLVVNSTYWSRQGFDHLVITLKPSQSSYSILLDRFTSSVRQQTIQLPNWWSIMFSPSMVFTKLISQEQSYFNLSLNQFDDVWQSYSMLLHTKTCYQTSSTFDGYIYLSLGHPELNEYYWHVLPRKASLQHWTVRLNQHTSQGSSLELFLEPDCGFELHVQFSLINSCSQLIKQYSSLLVPMIVSILILILLVQFCNVLLLYSFTDEKLTKFKNKYGVGFKESPTEVAKCFIFLNVPKVMVHWKYFLYCYVQIIIFSLISLALVKRFYPWHELFTLAQLPLGSKSLVCSITFMLAYACIYVITSVVHILANNFAFGVNYIYIRVQLVHLERFRFYHWFFMIRWKLLGTILLLCTFTATFIYFALMISYVTHMSFTILMLIRFIQLTRLEMRTGHTTGSSYVSAIYPVVYAFQLVLTVLNIPQSIDLMQSIMFSKHSLIWPKWSALAQWSTLESLFGMLFYLFIHFQPVNLHGRLIPTTYQRPQRWMTLSLFLFAFGNVLFGVLAFCNIKYSVMGTLAVITAHRVVLYKQFIAKEALKQH